MVGRSHKSWCILRQWGTNLDFCRFLVIYVSNLLQNQYKSRTGFIFPGCSTCSKNGSESTVSEGEGRLGKIMRRWPVFSGSASDVLFGIISIDIERALNFHVFFSFKDPIMDENL